MAALAPARAPWTDRRRRTRELRERHPFAAEVLTLYDALIDVQEAVWQEALGSPPAPEEVAAYTVARALPRVIDATMAAGPSKLSTTLVARVHSADLQDLVNRWLRSQEQAAADRYLARAAVQPVLEALGPVAGAACVGPRDLRHCPVCGGLPQLSYTSLSGEALVTGPRYLLCSRCLGSWQHPRLACPGCGEASSSRLPRFGEAEMLPHARVEGCESCHRYLIAFDLRKDEETVPFVDELAALPLDLYARDRGMTKVVPNLMGF